MADNAYIAGLTLLAARELSTAQLRQRLARRGFDPTDIDNALRRLTESGALDDARTAGALARTELRLRGHGRLRVRRSLHAAGIEGETARAALEDAFAAVDMDALLEAAIEKRLRPGMDLSDERARQRLFRHLVGKGFEPDRILTHIRRRQSRAAS